MELKDTAKMMNSPDYKERFIAEYQQTKIRYERLKAFNNKIEAAKRTEWTKNSKEMPKHDCPCELLREQQSIMGEYLHVLEVRAVIEGIELCEDCRDCKDCAHAHHIEDNVYECDAEECDTETLTCFAPRKTKHSF